VDDVAPLRAQQDEIDDGSAISLDVIFVRAGVA